MSPQRQYREGLEGPCRSTVHHTVDTVPPQSRPRRASVNRRWALAANAGFHERRFGAPAHQGYGGEDSVVGGGPGTVPWALAAAPRTADAHDRPAKADGGIAVEIGLGLAPTGLGPNTKGRTRPAGTECPAFARAGLIDSDPPALWIFPCSPSSKKPDNWPALADRAGHAPG